MLKNKKEYRLGVLAGGLDGVFLSSHHIDKNIKFIFLVPLDRPETKWAQAFLPKADIVYYQLKKDQASMALMDVQGVAKSSNLAKVLKQHQIEYLLVHHGIEKYLYHWAKKHQVKLIATDFFLREKLEDKIYFDNFLKKYHLAKPLSQIFIPGKTKITLPGKLVLQNPVSEGGEGTYFINIPTDIEKLLAKKKIKNGKQYLLRQFIKGETYGITVLISEQSIALSALRLQCYAGENSIGQKIFVGLQWLPSKYFSPKLIKDLNKVFLSAAQALKKQGFFGYANFDFMVDERDRVYIIECNPRFSASTTQLLQFSETISGINTGKIYLEEFLFKTKAKNKPKVSYFPKSNFAGSDLYIQTPSEQAKFKIAKHYQGGVYHLKNNKIIFKTVDITKLDKSGQQFVFYSDTRIGEVHKPNTVIASIISNFPLYDYQGNLNKYGTMILRHFKY